MTERVRVIDEKGINQREMERGVIGENNVRLFVYTNFSHQVSNTRLNVLKIFRK